MDDLVADLARFATQAHDGNLPDLARSLATDGMIDSIGCLFAGAGQPLASIVAGIVPRIASPEGLLRATCPVLGGFAAPADAAFFGATLTHALDYDDVNYPGLTHPSTILVPALLAAAAEAPHATGRALVTAYVVGVEALGKLGRMLNPGLFERGWHPTPTLGPPVVAIATAAMLGLDEVRTIAAMGIAMSSSAGLRANFGTMTKPYHAGQAARAGLIAALLARDGFTSSDEALGHRHGYLALFGGGQSSHPDPGIPGDPLEILSERGLEIKPYPACAAGQTVIEAGMILHHQIAGRPIASVIVRTGAPTMMPMIHRQPSTPLEGKFSLYYCVAASLLRGHVTIASFDEASIRAPDIATLIVRTRIVIDDARRDDYYFGVDLEVELDDGERLTCSIPRAKGTIARRIQDGELRAKFDDCTRERMSPEKSSRVWQAFRAIDTDVAVSELSALLAIA
jgi:2-methylcitrate dehydratase PrpD